MQSKFSLKEIYDLNTSLDFFQKEFYSLDQRTISILKSEITRITNTFVNDYDVFKTFCPLESELNFNGFSEVINSGKIVVLNMNISEYKNLSKIIAAYLKLDFQSDVLMRLANKKNVQPVAFVCDEYSEYATDNDANFFSESREAKCINILPTFSIAVLPISST